MRNIRPILMAASLLSAVPGLATAQTITSSASEAKTVVLHYLDALSQGDTATIRQLLGGKHLKTSRAMLENPKYADMLSNMYGAASYDIVDVRTGNAGLIEVLTVIRLGPDESLSPRFVLKYREGKGFKIVDEIENDGVQY